LHSGVAGFDHLWALRRKPEKFQANQIRVSQCDDPVYVMFI
jgi:hypothetical protein